MTIDDAYLHDFTHLIIDLWDEFRLRQINLSDLGNGDSMQGIEFLQRTAEIFLEEMPRATGKNNELRYWDGDFIDCCEKYAHNIYVAWFLDTIDSDHAREMARGLIIEHTYPTGG